MVKDIHHAIGRTMSGGNVQGTVLPHVMGTILGEYGGRGIGDG